MSENLKTKLGAEVQVEGLQTGNDLKTKLGAKVQVEELQTLLC